MRNSVVAAFACLMAIGVWLSVSQGPLLANNIIPDAKYNANADGVMLKGYDPVAYFAPDAVATPGDPAITLDSDGVTYFFASEENRARFAAAPEMYIPSYGGYCAYGVRIGEKLDIDPKVFRVVDGRLFLQLNFGTRLIWIADEAENIRTADNSWLIFHDQVAAAE